MDKRDINIYFGKAGNGIGAKMSIPVPWLRDMGVVPEDRQVEMSYDETTKTITIKKK